jgi:hypothetical protein
MKKLIYLSVLFLFLFVPSVHAAPKAVIRGAVIRDAKIAPVVEDPCAGLNVGDTCTNGVLYAGTGFAALGSDYKYMTTPGNCTDFPNNFTEFTPTCNGAVDTLGNKGWAAGTGTSAYLINTGLTGLLTGQSNTLSLTTMYTDTNAARYCANMVYPAGGYTDWYLPAQQELNLVFYGMHAAGQGNFTTGNFYWSSTELDANTSSSQIFNVPNNYGVCEKPNNHIARCIRRYL